MKNPNQINFDNVSSFLETLKNIKKYDKSQVKKLAKIFSKSSDDFLLFEQDLVDVDTCHHGRRFRQSPMAAFP